MASEDQDHAEKWGGSPTRIAWKYAWGTSSGASNISAGTGNAASERLYSSAASQRATRERLQKDAAKAATPKSRPHMNKRSKELSQQRFSKVALCTAMLLV